MFYFTVYSIITQSVRAHVSFTNPLPVPPPPGRIFPPQPFRLVSEKAAWSVGHLRVIFRDAKDVKGFVDKEAKKGKKKKKQ